MLSCKGRRGCEEDLLFKRLELETVIEYMEYEVGRKEGKMQGSSLVIHFLLTQSRRLSGIESQNFTIIPAVNFPLKTA